MLSRRKYDKVLDLQELDATNPVKWGAEDGLCA